MDHYNAPVMKAGYYKGGQYIIPLGYTLPALLLSDCQTLDVAGYDASYSVDVISFLNQINSLLPALEDSPSFYRVDNDIMLGKNLLTASGIPLVDAETRTVLPNEKEFRAFCQAYQPFYAMDTHTDNLLAGQYLDDALLDGKLLFVRPLMRSPYIFSYYAGLLSKDGSPVDIPLHSINGGMVASAECGVAINANSKNQLNAWNFIKIMLSQDIQTIDITKSTNIGLSKVYPVNNSAFEELIRQQPISMGFQTDINISDEYIRDFSAIINSVTHCELSETALTDMFYAKMEPYFKGEQSLDACVSALKSSLTVYVTE